MLHVVLARWSKAIKGCKPNGVGFTAVPPPLPSSGFEARGSEGGGEDIWAHEKSYPLAHTNSMEKELGRVQTGRPPDAGSRGGRHVGRIEGGGLETSSCAHFAAFCADLVCRRQLDCPSKARSSATAPISGSKAAEASGFRASNAPKVTRYSLLRSGFRSRTARHMLLATFAARGAHSQAAPPLAPTAGLRNMHASPAGRCLQGVAAH